MYCSNFVQTDPPRLKKQRQSWLAPICDTVYTKMFDVYSTTEENSYSFTTWHQSVKILTTKCGNCVVLPLKTSRCVRNMFYLLISSEISFCINTPNLVQMRCFAQICLENEIYVGDRWRQISTSGSGFGSDLFTERFPTEADPHLPIPEEWKAELAQAPQRWVNCLPRTATGRISVVSWPLGSRAMNKPLSYRVTQRRALCRR